MTETYSYTPLDSNGAQIRLLKVTFDITQALGYSSTAPITGSLKQYYLPLSTLPRAERIRKVARLPAFTALSYVWGDALRSHQLIIDGKALSITDNLYHALRDLQRESIGNFYAWIDAICINQDDLMERSAQVPLMRETYTTAASVRIWLGKSNEHGKRCMDFIADLTGSIGHSQEPLPDIDQRFNEKFIGAILKPTATFVRAGYGFGQALVQIGDLIEPSARDDKAQMILDSDLSLSLHSEIIRQFAKWQPSSGNLKKAQKENFVEIAKLIDQMIIDDCPWFSRMWVVQELGASGDPLTVYGGAIERWENFLRAIYYLHYTCKIPIRNIRKLTTLEKIRIGWNNGQRQPLQDLIREFRYRQATDPRDKVYALLGLMGDKMGPLLQPDYTKSVGEVYARTTLHFIIQRQSLDPICGWQIQDRQELPSWVPDYNLNQGLAPTPLVPQDRSESLFAASGHDHRSKYILDTSNLAEWSTLNVSGILIDIAAIVSAPIIGDTSFGANARMWCSALIAAKSLLPELSDEVVASLDILSLAIDKLNDCWDTVRRTESSLTAHSSEHQSLDCGTKARSSPQSSDPLHDAEETYIVDAYLHSMCCGGGHPSGRGFTKDLKRILLLQDSLASSSDEDTIAVQAAYEALKAGMTGRGLAITVYGHIGSVPSQAQPDDLMCVLYGCSVPVVLRKGEKDDTYNFVGECYLHGFMDAEAIAKQIKGDLHEQDFPLR